MSTVELGKADWFTVKSVEPNMFLNEKLTTDQYGTWYTVVWTDDAEKIYWQTKTPPEVGKTYWGWLEKTSTGKSIKFKWDKLNTPSEDAGSPVAGIKPQNGNWHESPEKQASINRVVALNNAVLLHPNLADDRILETAQTFYDWLSKTDKGKVDEVMGDTEAVNLDDIPY